MNFDLIDETDFSKLFKTHSKLKFNDKIEEHGKFNFFSSNKNNIFTKPFTLDFI